MPTSPLWPDPTPEPPSPKREGLLIGAAVLLSALLVLGGLFLWTRRSSNETDAASPATASGQADEPSGPSTDPTDSSSTTDLPDEEPEVDDPGQAPAPAPPSVTNVECPNGVPDEVCDAAAFVEDFRGRPFKEFPAVELVDDDAFAERLLRDFDDAREEIDVTTEVWRSLGFIESDVDLFDALRVSYEIGAVGVYFTDTKELYIQGTDLDLYAELVIVHELVHAHDDQWLDLDREEYDDADDEISYGFSAMIEGNARRVENAWREQLSAEDKEALSVLEFSVLSPEEIEIYLSLPQLLLQFQLSPYQDGLDLVSALSAAGGEQAIDDAFAQPPTTSEQVLHPELFAAEEAAVVVALPPSSGEVIDSGLVGELAFDLWLGDSVGDGWGGDSYVTWTTEAGACTRIDVIGDTQADTDEFVAAADTWSRSAQGRSVEVVDDHVRITGCY